MGMPQIAAVAAFVMLLQFNVYEARSCNYRSTVVQIRIPGKTNVTLRYPPKVDPVTFNPYPGKLIPECYICNGSSCKKCTQSDLNKSSPPSGSAPVRTNIIIDLKREKPKDSENNDPGKPDKPSESGNQKPTKDETFVVVQDTATATGTGKSVAIEKNGKGGESVASSATSVAATNSEVIGAFQQDSPTGESAKTNTENIYVESESQSTADTTATSGVSSDPVKPLPQAPPPAALPSPPEVSQPNPVEQPAAPPALNNNEKDEAIAASTSKAEADVKNTENGLDNASADAASTAKAVAENNDTGPNEKKEKAIADSAADAAASVTNDGATPAKKVAVAEADSKAAAT